MRGRRWPLRRPPLLQPPLEAVYLLDGLQVAVRLGDAAALFEDGAGLGVLAELEVGASEHPVGNGVVRLVLDGALQVVPRLGVAALLEELVAQRVEDHGVGIVPLQELSEHLRARALHLSLPSGVHAVGHF